MTDLVELVARAICKAENCDPDFKGVAISEETKARLGSTYPLWQYRIPPAQAAIDAVRKYDKENPNVQQ